MYQKTGVLRDPKINKQKNYNMATGAAFGIQPNICGRVCKYSQPVEAVDYFRRGAPSWMLDKIIKATLPNKLFSLAHPWPTHMQYPYHLQ